MSEPELSKRSEERSSQCLALLPEGPCPLPWPFGSGADVVVHPHSPREAACAAP